MAEPKDMFQTENFKGYTNTSCEFFPCHQGIKPEEFNCLFCYCPLSFLECPGPYKVFTDKNGNVRKDCSDCTLPHKGIKKSWNFIQHWLENPKPWSREGDKVAPINLYNPTIPTLSLDIAALIGSNPL